MAESFDEVSIVEDISERLITHHKLNSDDALYIIYHLKDQFEGLKEAELNGGLLEFKRKLKDGGK